MSTTDVPVIFEGTYDIDGGVQGTYYVGGF